MEESGFGPLVPAEQKETSINDLSFSAIIPPEEEPMKIWEAIAPNLKPFEDPGKTGTGFWGTLKDMSSPITDAGIAKMNKKRELQNQGLKQLREGVRSDIKTPFKYVKNLVTPVGIPEEDEEIIDKLFPYTIYEGETAAKLYGDDVHQRIKQEGDRIDTIDAMVEDLKKNPSLLDTEGYKSLKEEDILDVDAIKKGIIEKAKQNFKSRGGKGFEDFGREEVREIYDISERSVEALQEQEQDFYEKSRNPLKKRRGIYSGIGDAVSGIWDSTEQVRNKLTGEGVKYEKQKQKHINNYYDDLSVVSNLSEDQKRKIRNVSKTSDASNDVTLVSNNLNKAALNASSVLARFESNKQEILDLMKERSYSVADQKQVEKRYNSYINKYKNDFKDYTKAYLDNYGSSEIALHEITNYKEKFQPTDEMYNEVFKGGKNIVTAASNLDDFEDSVFARDYADLQEGIRPEVGYVLKELFAPIDRATRATVAGGVGIFDKAGQKVIQSEMNDLSNLLFNPEITTTAKGATRESLDWAPSIVQGIAEWATLSKLLKVPQYSKILKEGANISNTANLLNSAKFAKNPAQLINNLTRSYDVSNVAKNAMLGMGNLVKEGPVISGIIQGHIKGVPYRPEDFRIDMLIEGTQAAIDVARAVNGLRKGKIHLNQIANNPRFWNEFSQKVFNINSEDRAKLSNTAKREYRGTARQIFETNNKIMQQVKLDPNLAQVVDNIYEARKPFYESKGEVVADNILDEFGKTKPRVENKPKGKINRALDVMNKKLFKVGEPRIKLFDDAGYQIIGDRPEINRLTTRYFDAKNYENAIPKNMPGATADEIATEIARAKETTRLSSSEDYLNQLKELDPALGKKIETEELGYFKKYDTADKNVAIDYFTDPNQPRNKGGRNFGDILNIDGAYDFRNITGNPVDDVISSIYMNLYRALEYNYPETVGKFEYLNSVLHGMGREMSTNIGPVFIDIKDAAKDLKKIFPNKAQIIDEYMKFSNKLTGITMGIGSKFGGKRFQDYLEKGSLQKHVFDYMVKKIKTGDLDILNKLNNPNGQGLLEIMTDLFGSDEVLRKELFGDNIGILDEIDVLNSAIAPNKTKLFTKQEIKTMKNNKLRDMFGLPTEGLVYRDAGEAVSDRYSKLIAPKMGGDIEEAKKVTDLLFKSKTQEDFYSKVQVSDLKKISKNKIAYDMKLATFKRKLAGELENGKKLKEYRREYRDFVFDEFKEAIVKNDKVGFEPSMSFNKFLQTKGVGPKVRRNMELLAKAKPGEIEKAVAKYTEDVSESALNNPLGETLGFSSDKFFKELNGATEPIEDLMTTPAGYRIDEAQTLPDPFIFSTDEQKVLTEIGMGNKTLLDVMSEKTLLPKADIKKISDKFVEDVKYAPTEVVGGFTTKKTNAGEVAVDGEKLPPTDPVIEETNKITRKFDKSVFDDTEAIENNMNNLVADAREGITIQENTPRILLDQNQEVVESYVNMNRRLQEFNSKSGRKYSTYADLWEDVKNFDNVERANFVNNYEAGIGAAGAIRGFVDSLPRLGDELYGSIPSQILETLTKESNTKENLKKIFKSIYNVEEFSPLVFVREFEPKILKKLYDTKSDLYEQVFREQRGSKSDKMLNKLSRGEELSTLDKLQKQKEQVRDFLGGTVETLSSRTPISADRIIKYTSKFVSSFNRVFKALRNIAVTVPGAKIYVLQDIVGHATESLKTLQKFDNKQLAEISKEAGVLYNSQLVEGLANGNLGYIKYITQNANKLGDQFINAGMYPITSFLTQNKRWGEALNQTLTSFDFKTVDEFKDWRGVQGPESRKFFRDEAEKVFKVRNGQAFKYADSNFVFGTNRNILSKAKGFFMDSMMFLSSWASTHAKSTAEIFGDWAKAQKGEYLAWRRMGSTKVPYGSALFFDLLQTKSYDEAVTSLNKLYKADENMTKFMTNLVFALSIGSRLSREAGDNDDEITWNDLVDYEKSAAVFNPLVGVAINPVARLTRALVDGFTLGPDDAKLKSAATQGLSQVFKELTRSWMGVDAIVQAASAEVHGGSGLDTARKNFQYKVTGMISYQANEIVRNSMSIPLPKSPESGVNEFLGRSNEAKNKYYELNTRKKLLFVADKGLDEYRLKFNIPLVAARNYGALASVEGVDEIVSLMGQNPKYDKVIQGDLDPSLFSNPKEAYAHLYKLATKLSITDINKPGEVGADGIKQIRLTSKGKFNEFNIDPNNLFVSLLKEELTPETTEKLGELAFADKKAVQTAHLMAYAEANSPGSGIKVLSTIMAAEQFKLKTDYLKQLNKAEGNKIWARKGLRDLTLQENQAIESVVGQKYADAFYVVDKPGYSKFVNYAIRDFLPEDKKEAFGDYDPKDYYKEVGFMSAPKEKTTEEEGKTITETKRTSKMQLNNAFSLYTITQMQADSGEAGGYSLFNAFNEIYNQTRYNMNNPRVVDGLMNIAMDNIEYLRNSKLPKTMIEGNVSGILASTLPYMDKALKSEGFKEAVSEETVDNLLGYIYGNVAKLGQYEADAIGQKPNEKLSTSGIFENTKTILDAYGDRGGYVNKSYSKGGGGSGGGGGSFKGKLQNFIKANMKSFAKQIPTTKVTYFPNYTPKEKEFLLLTSKLRDVTTNKGKTTVRKFIADKPKRIKKRKKPKPRDIGIKSNEKRGRKPK